MLVALSGLAREGVDPTLVLAGVSYSLQLLNFESKQDSTALEACFSLLSQVVGIAEGNFQALHHIKTYLQQISLYLMEHLFPKVFLSSFRDWKEADRTCEGVLNRFFSLMEDDEVEHEAGLLATSGGLMNLLDDFLPSRTDRLGWDVPLVACLADALSLTAQLSAIISALVRQAVKFEKFPRSSGKALQMLLEAHKRSLQILRQRDSKSSQVFVALVLARELVVHGVALVEKATGDERAEDRFADIIDCVVDLLQLPFLQPPQDEGGHVEICTLEGRTLHVEWRPTAFASLHVVAASRRRKAPLPVNIALVQLYAAVALKSPGSDLHHMLQHCKAEAIAFSNALGLSMLLPDQSGNEIERIITCLHEIGCGDESLSAQAKEGFEALCNAKRDDFRSLLQCMRAVGELACMQCSALDEDTVERACRIAENLPESLGPAAKLLAMAGDDSVRWNIDFLSMDGEKAWLTSIMTHVLCFLGATHKGNNRGDLPPAIRPFAAFHDLDQSVLNSTFWPGLPDDWWHALRYSGLHKHMHPVNGNIVWAQCECGYRYCFAQCGAPVSSAPCLSPEGEGRCILRNGGHDHEFAPNQRLIAVVVTQAPHGDGWPPIYHTMKENFPAAFQPPAPSPGLFALTEADLQTSVGPNDRAALSHSLMSETVRQDWNQPLGKPPIPTSGLHPVSFRVLHMLVHASALASIEMEWVEDRENIVHLLQRHLREVARMNCVRTANDTVWYLMANIEADLAALAKLLNGTVEVATLFVHAVLHKLGSLGKREQPREQSLTSHEARVAYEKWFHETIIKDVLGEQDAAGNFKLPGVHALRSQAGQATDQNVVLTTDFLARRGLPTDAWLGMEEGIRSLLLPHILRPLVFATAEEAFEELIVASNGGNRFGILRLLMAGLDEDGSWQIQDDLLRAASLAWILPFMRLIRNKESGKMTMKDARRTTIKEWIEDREEHERREAWILFRNCEAAWNHALAAQNERVGCQVVPLPSLSATAPVAMLCPVVEAEKLGHGDLRVQDHPDPPEHIAAVALHSLAVSHNKVTAQLQTYLNAAGKHIKARLHPTAEFCQPGGQCLSKGSERNDAQIRLIQHAAAQDLFLFPSQIEDTCVANREEAYGPRTFVLDYKVENFLQAFFQIPWVADLPARGDHDFEAMENDIAWRLIAGRRPLQVSSEDRAKVLNINGICASNEDDLQCENM